MSRKRVKVTQESDSGRNQQFHDYYTNVDMTRKQFVNKIKAGEYPNYHIRKINRVETPVSNPDNSEANNLD
jgi:hypothetical protein